MILRKRKYKEKLRNKINTCIAALLLIKANKHVQTSVDALTYFGYNIDIGVKEIERRLSQDVYSLKILDQQDKQDVNKETVDFWNLVVRMESALERHIHIDEIVLSRWLEMTIMAKEKLNNTKANGKNWRNRQR